MRFFTKLDTHVNDKFFGQKKIIRRFATWWRKKTQKNCSWVTVSPIDLKFGIQYLCPKGTKGYKDIAYLKKHGRHWPNKFKHLLERLAEVIRTKLGGHVPLIVLKVCKNLKEIGH